MKGFKWTGWIKPQNQPENTKMITITTRPDLALPKVCISCGEEFNGDIWNHYEIAGLIKSDFKCKKSD